MNRNILACLTTALCLGAATPALADWDRIGTVDVGFRHDRDAKSFNFGGPVERLQLRADGSDINCRSVSATFGDGTTKRIFSGKLRENASTDIDMPGRERNIRQLSFNCGAQDRSGGQIRIVADIGNNREAWRRGPDFERVWSRVFNWGSTAMNEWRMVGSESFEGGSDSETSFAGRRGQRIDAIALRPVGSDARCSRVTAQFNNGKTRRLSLNNGDLLTKGRYEKLDLPGDISNVRSIQLRCRATDSNKVTIQIFTSRS